MVYTAGQLKRNAAHTALSAVLILLLLGGAAGTSRSPGR